MNFFIKLAIGSVVSVLVVSFINAFPSSMPFVVGMLTGAVTVELLNHIF